MPESNGALIAESVGTPKVFGVIFDRHFDSVHAYLQRQVGPDRAEDLAAQTFLIAFDKRAGFEPVHASARPWLFGIAVNLAPPHTAASRRRTRARTAARTRHLVSLTSSSRAWSGGPGLPTALAMKVESSLTS